MPIWPFTASPESDEPDGPDGSPASDPEARVEALQAALEAERARAKALEKQVRKIEKKNRRLEHTAKINGQIGERNKAMMFRAHEALTREIAKQKETEQQLRQAMDRAESAAEAKSAFLANMSHELRTPMNGVMGMLELAMSGPLSAEQAEYLRTARSSATDLLVLLNDILDLSKIEAGRLELESIPFSPWDAVDEVCAVLVPGALENGVPVRMVVGEGVPDEVLGDPVRFRQVLKNLLSNAIKFTAAGSITIALRYSEPDLITTITDTGIGISPERLTAIFQPFSQADASTTRRFGGTGLGLAIARHLAHLMGGRLQASSSPGVGSTFMFAARLPGQRLRMPPAPPLVGLRVGLKVGGEERPHILRTLASLGCRAETLDPRRPPGVVLLDETATEAEGEALTRQGCAVLRILDPHTTTTARRTLRRPLRRRLIAEQIRDAVEVSPAEPAPVVLPPRPVPQALRILVAEDHPVNQMLVRRFIEQAGFSCTVVSDGQAAVDQLRRAPFDLIFMDCQMPVMDGYTATRQIRALPLEQQPTIIALTASAMAGDRERALAAGMDDYLTKPVTQQAITDTLKGQGSESAAS